MDLETWESPFPTDAIDDEDVSRAISELSRNVKISKFLEGIATALFSGDFDWRTSSSPALDKNMEVKQLQSAFRGSSGYTILQQRALELLEKATMQSVSNAAKEVKARLGW
ncbi:MAG: hypothetical protein ACD_17C00329G0001 [uncultured bacterium]|nr:MAG: hypothetical protein ACD_17C00329G0001 [uncultured bacterium]